MPSHEIVRWVVMLLCVVLAFVVYRYNSLRSALDDIKKQVDRLPAQAMVAAGGSEDVAEHDMTKVCLTCMRHYAHDGKPGEACRKDNCRFSSRPRIIPFGECQEPKDRTAMSGAFDLIEGCLANALPSLGVEINPLQRAWLACEIVKHLENNGYAIGAFK